MTKQANAKPLILLLEDEVLIALTLQDELQDAGFAVAGPFTTCAAALGWLGAATPSMAILDAALKDGPCREIALELSRREVPFLIYSGHQENGQLLAEFQHITWIEKPVPSVVLVQACQKLLVGCV
ncbi:histidine kinase [Microvirga yunnanensis]|uniref:histidine kinase n=1 Tax=Microvirga yunnanensis TaxID=2953740 RepID=UPI0021C9661C|nr:histidine kinase [Microvirga sp. HBU65207]